LLLRALVCVVLLHVLPPTLTRTRNMKPNDRPNLCLHHPTHCNPITSATEVGGLEVNSVRGARGDASVLRSTAVAEWH
jgi:hypothetical protein